MRHLLAAFLVVCVACDSSSEDEPPDAAPAPDAPPELIDHATMTSLVDEAAAPLIADRWLPGLVVALIDADGVQFLTYGRGVGEAAPDADTLYEIGSISKTVNGLLLAREVDAGRLRLDQPVAELLPEATVPTRGDQPITLAHLVTHRAGLPAIPADLPAGADDPYAGYDAARLYAALASMSLDAEPGSRFAYSNLGAALLGHALAVHRGTPYAELVGELTAGLGLPDTALTAIDPARLAPGHRDTTPVPAWTFDVFAPAGALRSSARDVARLVQAELGLIDAGTLQGAIEISQTPLADTGFAGLGIAYAWLISDGNLHWHDGGTGGYRSFAGFDRERGRGLVVLTNGTAEPLVTLGLHLLGVWAGRDAVPAPVLPPTVTLPDATLAGYAGTYVFAPTFSIVVRAADAHLFVQATDQPELELWASAEDQFYLRVVDARITFERGDGGEVTAMVLDQGGVQQRGERAP